MLPIFQTPVRELSQMQTQWASELNPIIAMALLKGNFIDVVFSTGANTFNHKLQRKPQGWFIVDQDAAGTLYRSQPFNALTLTLTSSAPANVTVYVF